MGIKIIFMILSIVENEKKNVCRGTLEHLIKMTFRNLKGTYISKIFINWKVTRQSV